MPCAADLRQPRLREFSLADAALYLPALGGHGGRARGPGTCVGAREQAARLSDAGRGHSADPASDGSAVVENAGRACSLIRRNDKVAGLGQPRLAPRTAASRL